MLIFANLVTIVICSLGRFSKHFRSITSDMYKVWGGEGKGGGLTLQRDARSSYGPEKQAHRPQSLFKV